jgi:hypothetical protein
MTMFRKTVLLLSSLLILTAALPALAHEEAKGPHGGQVVDSAGHHLEFVPSPSELTFFLSDEAGKPLPSAGSSGKAIVQDASKTSQLDLAPAAPDKLTGKLSAPLAPGAKIAVTATMADGHVLQALFVNP